MNTSDQTDKVLPALLKSASDFRAVTFDATNSHFKSKYATLPAYLDAVTPALRKHGLLLTQGTRIVDGSTVVHTRITHAESGQWVGSDYPVHPVKPDPQAEGSALTYARRYALAALLGLAADDDDGQAASDSKADVSDLNKAKSSEFSEAIRSAATLDVLKKVGSDLASSKLPDNMKAALRQLYSARQAELSKAQAA